MPQELQEWLPREGILSFEETLRLVRIAVGLGVSKVRVTAVSYTHLTLPTILRV